MTRQGTAFGAEEYGEQLTATERVCVCILVHLLAVLERRQRCGDEEEEEEVEQQSSATMSGSQGCSNVKWSVAPVAR